MIVKTRFKAEQDKNKLRWRVLVIRDGKVIFRSRYHRYGNDALIEAKVWDTTRVFRNYFNSKTK